MEEFADVRLNRLSTGMIQKYNLARGLVNNPRVLFLDEPTLGLDVEVARYIRGLIKKLVAEDRDRTVFLTTHYMAEAEELCDRIAIIHRGRIVALGSPGELKALASDEVLYKVEVRGLHSGLAKAIVREGLATTASLKSDIISGTTTLKLVFRSEGDAAEAIRWLVGRGFTVISAYRVEPTLEDVFLKLVGRGLHEQGS